jgi:hypothetical protein
MRIAAPAVGGPGAKEDLGIPEGLGDDVDHSVPLLDPAGDAQEARGLDEHHVLLEDPAPDHNVHEASFIFEGHEDHSGGCPGALPADNDSRIADGLAVPHGMDPSRPGEPAPAEPFAERRKRMPPGAVLHGPIVRSDGLEKIELLEGGKSLVFLERQGPSRHVREPSHLPEGRPAVAVKSRE